MRPMLLLFVICLCSANVFGQDDDYYRPKKSEKRITKDLSDLYSWGPKLGIEVNAAVDYDHLLMPSTIAGSFDKAFGGVGFDGGIGIRMRAYHKLAFAGGFNYAIRSFSLKYQAQDLTSGDQLSVSEKATMHYLGFYYKTLIEISRKFHIAQTFQYLWLTSYNGTVSADDITNPANFYPPQPTDRPILEGWRTENQAELGVEFAYKWMISPELILKPYISIGLGLTPVLHTNAFMSGFFGQEEQNPHYVNLRFGVILETGLWLDKLTDK